MKLLDIFKKNKTNVIMITIDQLRSDKIDEYSIFQNLAKRGVYFNNMITYAPYTLASMHAFFTGMPGSQNGVNSYYGVPNFKKDDCFTLTQYLKKNGYFTRADFNNEMIAPLQGFDLYEIHDERKDNLIKRHKRIIEDTHRKNKNYFLYLHFSSIHTRMVDNVIHVFDDFEKDYFQPSNRKLNQDRYKGYVQKGIDYLEEIIGFLDDNKILDNCLLLIQNDHGCSEGEKPGELAYGVYLYDYTIKLWSFMLCNNLLPENKKIDIQVRSIDLLPTVLNLLNIPEESGYLPIQGKSLIPIIQGSETQNREAFIETSPNHGPIKSPDEPILKALRTNGWKLIYNEKTDKKELYNLIQDPEEINNLSGQGLEIENDLWERLSRM